MSDTENLKFYAILVLLLLVYWKNQVRCTSVARAYLGLFSLFFFFEKDWTTLLACLLACLRRYSRERTASSSGGKMGVQVMNAVRQVTNNVRRNIGAMARRATTEGGRSVR